MLRLGGGGVRVGGWVLKRGKNAGIQKKKGTPRDQQTQTLQ
jgi:hypothetical protein